MRDALYVAGMLCVVLAGIVGHNAVVAAKRALKNHPERDKNDT